MAISWSSSNGHFPKFHDKQVAQWATIAHLRASIMFADTILDDAQRQVTQELIKNTNSPMGNNRSPWSQHNVWRHHNLQCSKADNSELETVIRN